MEFHGTANGMPMLVLSRSIEIDLLEMLGGTQVPAPVEPVNGECNL